MHSDCPNCQQGIFPPAPTSPSFCSSTGCPNFARSRRDSQHNSENDSQYDQYSPSWGSPGRGSWGMPGPRGSWGSPGGTCSSESAAAASTCWPPHQRSLTGWPVRQQFPDCSRDRNLPFRLYTTSCGGATSCNSGGTNKGPFRPNRHFVGRY